jgi:sulfite exporter TauE/SafE
MEEVGLLSILSLGFILGIKHAVEPDHIIAVSTVAGQSRKLSTSALTGVFWGIGHTATLFLAGVSVILLKGEIPEKWAMSLEFLVGIMLVYFGVSAFLSFNKRHRVSHSQLHSSGKVPYRKSVFMGFIHGLAGSAAMIFLTMSTVSSVWEAVLYILIFGAGTIVGMLCFTTIIGIPFILSTKNVNINGAFTRVTGLISTVFGFYYMYNLGVTEGLFKLWIQ